MAEATVNGVQLYYELQGAGDAVVFVHGSLCDHHDWDVVAAQLADSFHVLSYDRRGHSQSSGNGTLDDDLADVAALIEQLQLAPVHLVGSSLGGCIALRLAIARPQLLRSMSVHEPPLLALLIGDPETQPELEYVLGRIQIVLSELSAGKTELGCRRFVEELTSGTGAWEELPSRVRATIMGTAATFVEENTDPSIDDIDLHALVGVEVPVLLTQGAQSPPFLAAILDRVHAVLPQVERRILQGTGHDPQITHPDMYAEELRTFMTQVSRGGAQLADQEAW
jgi:pimeloyl-ACP methyl ester carboxylesterase